MRENVTCTFLLEENNLESKKKKIVSYRYFDLYIITRECLIFRLYQCLYSSIFVCTFFKKYSYALISAN